MKKNGREDEGLKGGKEERGKYMEKRKEKREEEIGMKNVTANGIIRKFKKGREDCRKGKEAMKRLKRREG